jgi:hypothetical protein
MDPGPWYDHRPGTLRPDTQDDELKTRSKASRDEVMHIEVRNYVVAVAAIVFVVIAATSMIR